MAQVEVEQKSEVSFGIDGYSSMTVDYSQLFTTMIEGDDLSETIDPARFLEIDSTKDLGP